MKVSCKTRVYDELAFDLIIKELPPIVMELCVVDEICKFNMELTV